MFRLYLFLFCVLCVGVELDGVGRVYNNHSSHHHQQQLGYGDYEQYPEYGSYGGGMMGGYGRPSTPSEASDSPSLPRNNNSGPCHVWGHLHGNYNN